MYQRLDVLCLDKNIFPHTIILLTHRRTDSYLDTSDIVQYLPSHYCDNLTTLAEIE